MHVRISHTRNRPEPGSTASTPHRRYETERVARAWVAPLFPGLGGFARAVTDLLRGMLGYI